MRAEPTLHPVHRSINRPLTIWGVERRIFFLAMVMGAATFNFFSSLLSGLLVFLGLYLAARWVTQIDPQFLHILFTLSRMKAHYDPAKRERFTLEVKHRG